MKDFAIKPRMRKKLQNSKSDQVNSIEIVTMIEIEIERDRDKD